MLLRGNIRQEYAPLTIEIVRCFEQRGIKHGEAVELKGKKEEGYDAFKGNVRARKTGAAFGKYNRLVFIGMVLELSRSLSMTLFLGKGIDEDVNNTEIIDL